MQCARMMVEHRNPPEEGARCSKRKRNVGWSRGERFGSCANETQKLFAGSSITRARRCEPACRAHPGFPVFGNGVTEMSAGKGAEQSNSSISREQRCRQRRDRKERCAPWPSRERPPERKRRKEARETE
jgi:hypothetical protein